MSIRWKLYIKLYVTHMEVIKLYNLIYVVVLDLPEAFKNLLPTSIHQIGHTKEGRSNHECSRSTAGLATILTDNCLLN